MAKPSKIEHPTLIRLAENDESAVDMCDCGTLQLHLGGLSLRLPPDVVVNLARTLTAALARRQAILAGRIN
jgi:hypothetical protein